MLYSAQDREKTKKTEVPALAKLLKGKIDNQQISNMNLDSGECDKGENPGDRVMGGCGGCFRQGGHGRRPRRGDI